jgi:NADPH-dependent glutamate synthase beta subunit-like oxidoreductase
VPRALRPSFLRSAPTPPINLGIEGENDFPQVHGAVDFLQRVALGERRCPGKHVVVIGGGNVAIDAARTCLRLGSQEVTIAYRRTRKEMPADHEEVEQAEEEGVHFELLTVPMAVVGEENRVLGLRCLKAKLVTVPGSNRQSPKPIEGSDYDIPADAIISAIGQRIERQWFGDPRVGLDSPRHHPVQHHYHGDQRSRHLRRRRRGHRASHGDRGHRRGQTCRHGH